LLTKYCYYCGVSPCRFCHLCMIILDKLYKFILFILLILFCGLIQVPITGLVFLIQKMPFTFFDLIRDGVLITYSISLFSASCYTSFNTENRNKAFRVFTVICAVLMFFAATAYAVVISESVIRAKPVSFPELLIPYQIGCSILAILYCFVVEFCLRSGRRVTRLDLT
jgi:hypothetical protein